jgi:hypothetical protein
MDGLELGLSHGFRLSAMVSYEGAMNRYGACGRAIAALTAVLAAALFASPAWRTVQLLPLVAGVALALIDAYPVAVQLEAQSGTLRRWLAASATDITTAAPNLAGLFEGFGVVAGILLFAGPLAAPMPLGARIVGLVALDLFAVNAFSQVAADPGYYNMDPAPARWTVAVRWLLPAAAAVSALVILRSSAGSAVAPVPWPIAVLLASSFLLIWPYVAILNLLLRCAAESAQNEVSNNLRVQQFIHHEYVHRAKNELRPSFRRVASDAEYDAFSAAVVVVENARRDIEASAAIGYDDAHPVGELWKTYQRTIDEAALRDRLRFTDCTDGRKLSRTEGLILQSIFGGFVSNALRAHPQEVAVTVSDDADDQGAPLIRVLVEDDGAGGAPSAFEPGSGLARLDEMCRQQGGRVQITPHGRDGTQAAATFSCPSRLIDMAGKTNDLSPEVMANGRVPSPGGRRRPGIHYVRHILAPPRS